MTFGSFIAAWVGFLFISVASSQVSLIFPTFGLPLITGYMFFGMAVGPQWLQLVPQSNLSTLVYITQFALAFISLSAGAELYLPELKQLFKRILTLTISMTIVTFFITLFVIFGLSQTKLIPFMYNLNGDFPINACRFSISLIAASIMVTQSPASAIAVVQETKSKGPFTSTMLGVTVLTDVIVLLLYSVAASVANAECDPSSTGFAITDLLLTIFCILMAMGVGWIVGKLIIFLIWLPRIPGSWIVPPLGFGIFQLSEWVLEQTTDHYGHGVNLDPLLICITAGYIVANQSRNRRKFLRFLARVGPIIFIPFFTLTGAALKLGVVFESLSFAVITFLVRVLCFAIGSYVAGHYSQMPEKHKRTMFISMLTQAGVSLGIAAEVALAFKPPSWGPDFQSTIISVILFNQIVGPVACKWALKHNGEVGMAHDEEEEENSTKRLKRALVVGVNNYALSTIQRLIDSSWNVLIIDTDLSKAESLALIRKRPENEKTTEMHKMKIDPFKEPIKPPEEVQSPSIIDQAGEYAPLPLNSSFNVPKNISSNNLSVNELSFRNQLSVHSTADTPVLDATPQLEFRQLHCIDFETPELLASAIDIITQDLRTTNLQSALVCLESDKNNFTLAQHLLSNRGISRVSVIVNHPLWASALMRIGALPIFSYGITVSTLLESLIREKTETIQPIHNSAKGPSYDLFAIVEPELSQNDKELHKKAEESLTKNKSALGLAAVASDQIEKIRGEIANAVIETLTRSGSAKVETPDVAPFYASITGKIDELRKFNTRYPPPDSLTDFNSLLAKGHSEYQLKDDILSIHGSRPIDLKSKQVAQKANITFAGVMLSDRNSLMAGDEDDNRNVRDIENR